MVWEFIYVPYINSNPGKSVVPGHGVRLYVCVIVIATTNEPNTAQHKVSLGTNRCVVDNSR